jgi:hypothetical protein
MKKIIAVAVSIFIASISYGQGLSIFQKKVNLNDFSSKTTQVVVNGNNSLDDIMLINAVKKYWHLSPYNICTMEEFEKIKCDTSYYFLMKVDGHFAKEKEPSMEFLTLLKGDEKGAQGLNAMPEILSLPYRALDDDSGDSFAYLEPFITIIQNHVVKIQEQKFSWLIGISAYSDGMNGVSDMDILFSEEDFAFDVTQQMLDGDFHGKAKLTTKDEIESAIKEWRPNTLVSIVVSPKTEQKGAFCFKMLISTETRELYLYKKHKLGGKVGTGFTKEDYKRIAAPYAY